MKFIKVSLLSVMLLGLLLGRSASAQDEETLTVLAHDSFAVSEEVLAQFEAETGIKLEILLGGDAGTMINQAILSRNNPQADVIFGVDNTFLGRALDNELFIPYESPMLEDIPADFIVDEHVTPIDFGDVCLNYDKAYFEGRDLPTSLQDLTDAAYKGQLVVENPATSSPGLAFLLATISEFGTEGDYTYLDFWADLVDNEVLVVDDWTAAYFTEFSIAGGEYPMVVSYASSPPVEVLFADPPVEEPPTASLVADGMCFRQIEYAGILNGTDHEEAAQKFIDFMLGQTFQEDVPLQMFVYPVNPEAELPEIFVEHSQIPENPVLMDFAEINENREAWIEAWTETVLR